MCYGFACPDTGTLETLLMMFAMFVYLSAFLLRHVNSSDKARNSAAILVGKQKNGDKTEGREGQKDLTCAMNFPSISCLFNSSAVGSP